MSETFSLHGTIDMENSKSCGLPDAVSRFRRGIAFCQKESQSRFYYNMGRSADLPGQRSHLGEDEA
jgi:hypothetical protein